MEPQLTILIEHLMKTPHAKQNSTKMETMVRCPYCGDSIKSNNPHFYIQTGKIPHLYSCKRCSVKGILMPDNLHKLGINDIHVDEYLKRVHKNKRTINTNEDYSIYSSVCKTIPKEFQYKFDYFFQRTGIKINENTVTSYRLIPSIKKFLEKNSHIKLFISYIDNLEKWYLGFLSHSGDSIQFRRIDDNGRKHHVVHLQKYRRFPYFYIPPCSIDLLTSKPQIVISEGPFDIINIQKYFFSNNSENILFSTSASRGSFVNVCMRLLKITGFFGAELFLYVDQDVIEDNIQFSFIPKIFKTQIIINELNKDFGDIRDKWKQKTVSI